MHKGIGMYSCVPPHTPHTPSLYWHVCLAHRRNRFHS